jgi:hypothetical protein
MERLKMNLALVDVTMFISIQKGMFGHKILMAHTQIKDQLKLLLDVAREVDDVAKIVKKNVASED